jgi:capsular polysaccharide biosynthesis protein
MLNMLIAVFVGTMLAIAMALMAEIVDRRVRAPADIEQGLELHVLGVLDKPKSKNKSGLLNFKWFQQARA